MQIEENGNMHGEELNYRKGYSALFNGISQIIKLLLKMVKQLMLLQQQGEEACISESSENRDIAPEEIIERVVEILKQNIQEEK